MDNNAAKKSLGQHWLNDEASLEAMCDAVEVGAGDTILEVGPGHGSLTAKLLDRGAKVVAVELDGYLVDAAQEKFKGREFEVTQESILDFDLTALQGGYKVVANIPYYLTSNLLRMLCESTNSFSQAALLIQKEVAERVAAEPGDMGILSVTVQFYCDVGLGPVIGAELFSPPPKVDSQILMLDYRGPKFADVDVQKFFGLVKAGFSERRKMLRSSLSGGLHIPKEEATLLLQKAQIPPTARAQELSLDQWHQLFISHHQK